VGWIFHDMTVVNGAAGRGAHRPVAEHDRLPRRHPADAAGGDEAVRPADALGEREEDVVLAHEVDGERRVLVRRPSVDGGELRLRVPGIAVEVRGDARAAIRVAEPARPGDVQEEVGLAADARDRRPVEAVPGAVRRADGPRARERGLEPRQAVRDEARAARRVGDEVSRAGS
jgi:hypothetical protein